MIPEETVRHHQREQTKSNRSKLWSVKSEKIYKRLRLVVKSVIFSLKKLMLQRVQGWAENNRFLHTNRSTVKKRVVSKQSIHNRKQDKNSLGQRVDHFKAVLKRRKQAHKEVREDYAMDRTRKLSMMLWQKASKPTGRVQPRRTIR